MKNRGFTLTVLLILAAAMFASNLNSNPTGKFFEFEERYPACNCIDFDLGWQCTEMCSSQDSCKTESKVNWNCDKGTLCKNVIGKINLDSSMGLKPFKIEIEKRSTGNC